MDNIGTLPHSVENLIKNFIEEKFEQDGLHSFFQNPLLRDDVLDLLDRYCTVVYYPLDNEENNGFHITNVPFADGSSQNFVFINTAQTIEKQIFTAAHELGHIWEVDDYIIKTLGLDSSTEMREMIINRFAAVLLIPAENFLTSVHAELNNLRDFDGKTITFENMLKLIVALMNQFYVPIKAIVLRLVELGFFSDDSANILLGNSVIPNDSIMQLVKEQFVEMGYTHFLFPSRKKWIDRLSEKLEIAERDGLVSSSKIAHIREMFDLKATITNDKPELDIPISTQEGFDIK